MHHPHQKTGRFLDENMTALSLGLRRKKNGKTLDVTYPVITVHEKQKVIDCFEIEINTHCIHHPIPPIQLESLSDDQLKLLGLEESITNYLLKHPQSNKQYADCDTILTITSNLQKPIESVEEAYFKLQLMSQRVTKPHQINLDQLFATLENLAWSNFGPIRIEDVEEERMKRLFSSQPLQITHVDKFPYLINYHIPTGVRIASGSQVRLGAYLGEGTTVMPAGYVNFNAGTDGEAMIEGRVSAGVVVGKNTDIGGGASIMGTLSGGNKDIISIGTHCLLGANAGAGISLGHGCTIAAGLYVYSGMKVSLYNEKNTPINLEGNPVEEGLNIVKAKELSGQNNLLFIQDSHTGKVICKPNPKTIELNSDLHQNT